MILCKVECEKFDSNNIIILYYIPYYGLYCIMYTVYTDHILFAQLLQLYVFEICFIHEYN